MPGTLQTWPPWLEFEEPTDYTPKDQDFDICKQAIIAEYGEEKLRQSWVQVCQDLELVTAEIAEKRSDIFPIFDCEAILKDGFSAEDQAAVKKYGCFIVRQTVSQDEARQAYEVLRQYRNDNQSEIQGWPAESPSMMMIYDSPTQIALRTHPNQLRLQRVLNQLWHDSSAETSPEPLLYSDGIRDRPPKQVFLGLGPHIDAGSLCRWADPTYRRAYEQIFAGNPRAHDAYNLAARKNANQTLFPGRAHSNVFRSFQGWTALTRAAASEGAIMLYPNVSTVIAYTLLRPFFRPPRDPKDVMDATKWEFDADGAWFPGTFKPDSQRLSRASHPHLRLEQCLTHIPDMRPGDTVWWHTDVCHAVDAVHNGRENASVAYIAACPKTESNIKYMKAQLQATREGRPPPDFAAGLILDERHFKGYRGHQGLSEAAKAALGYYL
ncbi:hypothetical protein A1O3_06799 [Capronia epimyces CBS 606.96]|uniref:DUF1479 domain protein n=1 Tax=Capronia epimyces CBS 606.96 TaxID=1182542 RepID=W9XR16_9EURO|nr:uncharacterized protein A1O3_06799 [Capronia epimyces CBS 606.96]EXJ82982.1 hypothetical protein A1O3_06799 [Capronia epimyces CBS 606.96]